MDVSLCLLVLLIVGTCGQENNVYHKNTTYCSFEHGDCGWRLQATVTDGYEDKWTRSPAKSSTFYPSADHTYGIGSGNVLGVNPENYGLTSTNRRVVQAITPSFSPAENYCIQFFYQLYGDDASPLKVYIQEYEGLGYPIKTINPSSNQNWQYASVEIDSEYTSTIFKIVFEVSLTSYKYYSVSNGHYSYRNTDVLVAIDDIYISNSKCSAVRLCPENVNTCYIFNSSRTTWTKAVETCKKLSAFGHLVSIETEDKQKDIVAYIKNDKERETAAQNGGIWTSGVDIDREGTWVWSSNQHLVNYTDWKSGQPNNVGNRQDCLVLDYPSQGYSWGDEYCDLEKPFICQITMNSTIHSPVQIIG